MVDHPIEESDRARNFLSVSSRSSPHTAISASSSLLKDSDVPISNRTIGSWASALNNILPTASSYLGVSTICAATINACKKTSEARGIGFSNHRIDICQKVFKRRKYLRVFTLVKVLKSISRHIRNQSELSHVQAFIPELGKLVSRTKKNPLPPLMLHCRQTLHCQILLPSSFPA